MTAPPPISGVLSPETLSGFFLSWIVLIYVSLLCMLISTGWSGQVWMCIMVWPGGFVF